VIRWTSISARNDSALGRLCARLGAGDPIADQRVAAGDRGVTVVRGKLVGHRDLDQLGAGGQLLLDHGDQIGVREQASAVNSS
jgi:hypothetical protein